MKLFAWTLLVGMCFCFLSACATSDQAAVPSLNSFEAPPAYNNHAMDIAHKL